MKFHVGRRLFLAAAVLGGLAVLALGLFLALGMRSVVAGPAADPLKPNPGHEWSEMGLPPGTWPGLDADKVDGQDASELQCLWTQSGNDLYPNDLAWNVGIGTTSPEAKLDVIQSGHSCEKAVGPVAAFITETEDKPAVIAKSVYPGACYIDSLAYNIGIFASGTDFAGYFVGDSYFSGKLIMRSPDWTCSACGPDNSDVWHCSSIACP